MASIKLPAPVKINLFLHILGRREDGYHELQTVFQLLDAGDRLSFSHRSDGEIHLRCSNPTLQTDDNLVMRAARLLQKHLLQKNLAERKELGQQQSHVQLGADIELRKIMPVGGGIGGGSSDAATTLLGLNWLWRGGLGEAELMSLGCTLGADVPVFIGGHSAWAEGTGERLQAVELPRLWYLVLTPEVEVSTAAVFAHPQLTRDSAAITVAAFFEQGTPTQSVALRSALNVRNDCQPLVAKLYPQVAEAIEWLDSFAPARLTGTGASVFAPFESESAARAVLSQSPWPGFVAKGINQSPVHGLLKKADLEES